MLLIINNVSVASSWFQVIGDVTNVLAAGDYIQVRESTGNDGVYQLAAAAYSTGVTRLTTIEPVTSAVPDGFLSMGVYDLKFSNDGIDGKDTIVIAPYGTDESTSLKFNGKASLNFGEWQQENMLHVLENFASDAAPTNPTIGQHWYDHTNSVTKTFVSGSVWSTDVNVENGVLSFKDPQHPTPNTKYFLTASEGAGKTGSGVTLYPAANPGAGNAMFRIVDSAGTRVFGVEYNGKLTSSNPLEVTSTTASTLTGPVVVNTSGTGTTGLTVTKNTVITNGDLLVDTGKSFMLTGGGRVTLTNSVVLRGSSTTAGVVIQSTGGVSVATFADASIAFTTPTTVPTLNATDVNTTELDVTGIATIEQADITELEVSGTSTLAVTTATQLTVTGATTLAAATATTFGVSGAATIATANITTGNIVTLNVTGTATVAALDVTTLDVSGATTLSTLGVSGTSTLATTNVATLTVSGATTLATVAVTTLGVSGTSTLATVNVTTLGVSGTSTLSATTATTLGVSGTTTLSTADVTTLGVSGTATIGNAAVTTLTTTTSSSLAAATATTLTVTGATSVPTPTADAHIANKQYVDTKEPAVAAGTVDQYYAGNKTWKDFQWDQILTPAIAGGVLTLDLSTPTGFRVALTENVTSVMFTNAPADKAVAFVIEWVQNATGGYTVTWPASVITEDGSTPSQPDPTALATTVHSFITTNGASTVRMSGVAPESQMILLPVGTQTASIPTGTNVESFYIPYDFVVTGIQASLRVAQATGVEVSVDAMVDGVSILSAPVTFVNTSRTTITNPTQPTIATPLLIAGKEVTLDVTADGATATGLKVVLIGYGA